MKKLLILFILVITFTEINAQSLIFGGSSNSAARTKLKGNANNYTLNAENDSTFYFVTTTKYIPIPLLDSISNPVFMGLKIKGFDSGIVHSNDDGVLSSTKVVNADISNSAAIDATKVGGGTISNTEFGYLNNLSSNAQTQFDSKLHFVSSNSELVAYTGNIAYYNGSVWDKLSGDISSDGGSFAGTKIRISSSYFWKRRYDYIIPEFFGAVGDGITDETSVLATMSDALQDGQKLVFEKIYLFDRFIIKDKKNLEITGNGTLKGRLYIGDTTATSTYEYHIKITNIKIDLSHFASNAGKNAITLANAFNIIINKVTFKRANAAVYIYPINRFQQVARVSINDNRVERDLTVTERGCNYFVYCDNVVKTYPYTSSIAVLGDITISNNLNLGCNIAHVEMYGVDGALIENNVFFHSGATEKSQIKNQNIKIGSGIFINIANNNMFEAGYEGILLEQVSNATIVGNNIVWCGQRDVTYGSGIRIRGLGFNTVERTSISVLGNVIARPTRSGIIVEDSATYVNVTGNQISQVGYLTNYYGDGALSVGNPSTNPNINSVPHYGITYSSNVTYSNFVGNNSPDRRFYFPTNESLTSAQKPKFFGNTDNIGRVTTLTSIESDSSLTIDNFTFITLSISAGGTIDQLVGGNIGDIITLYNSNTALTLKNNTYLLLQERIDASFPNLSTITFVNTGNNTWQEVARVFNYNLTLRGTTTTTGLMSITPTSTTATNVATRMIVGNLSTAVGNSAGDYRYVAEFQSSSTSNINRLQIAPYRKVAGSGFQGVDWRLQYAADNSFTDGSKAYVEIGAGDPATSGGGYVALGTAGFDRLAVNNAGNVGIGTTQPNSKSALDIPSTTKGIFIPRMSTTQRNAISLTSGELGLLVYDNTLLRLMSYDGTSWGTVGALTGSASQALSAGTTITVTIGTTMPNTSYKVNVTATSALALGGYVTNKTTTTFDYVLPSTTGTVTFDWSVAR